MTKTRTIALTGGIGAGKSTVLDIAEKSHGAKIISADALVHAMFEDPSSEIALRIRDRFGADVVDQSGVRRDLLGPIVFQDPDAKSDLEAIVHPAVRSAMLAQIQDAAGQCTLIFVEVPLLFESNLHEMFPEIWTVSASKEVRVTRVVERDGLDESAILARMDAQLSDQEKEDRADFVLHNNGSRSDLERQIEERLNARNSPFNAF